jgi:hypothetical protein
MSIYLFYHICCTDSAFGIVKDQITKIIFSGLYKKVTKIYCCLVGTNPYILNDISKILEQHGTKFSILAYGQNDTTFERFTLNRIKALVQPEDKLLYLHTKGVSHTVSQAIQSIASWRTSMEYFLIARHEQCLADLDTHDAVGIMWHGTHQPQFKGVNYMHFSGNFWWTTGAYFKTLPEKIGEEYWDPEMYIGKGNPKVRVYYDPVGFNPYADVIQPRSYVDT